VRRILNVYARVNLEAAARGWSPPRFERWTIAESRKPLFSRST